MRQTAARSAAAFLVVALLAPVLGAGAVLADELRDMVAGNTGLADNPETPGPDLYSPLAWGRDIPDMPSLVALDLPEGSPAIAASGRTQEGVPDPAVEPPGTPAIRELTARGPPLPAL